MGVQPAHHIEFCIYASGIMAGAQNTGPGQSFLYFVSRHKYEIELARIMSESNGPVTRTMTGPD
ncbi:hypothetical protein Gxy13693_002_071 [Komagataeibacter xylinus NBRC 13693]|uniref:Uncharacterized protein n=1 Tax=Komagataeibacter xylinus NBRC 13693 TaxID=1234668 RepID=A0A0D6Q6F4_KOMXY|nr:hypothetical protein Gxy13693_002_071 [Komagataeibacter xylinus NBRC 13693]